MSVSKLATRVIKSIFFIKAQQKAVDYAKNNKKMSELPDKVGTKSKTLHVGEDNTSFLENLNTLKRMVKAFKQGYYKEIPWRSFLLVVAGLIYFVSPVDFMPDFLPILGFTDDVAVILWIFTSIKSDIENFKSWETQKSTSISE